MRTLITASLFIAFPLAALSQSHAPSEAVRVATLKSVAHIYATDCKDNVSRAGSGFLLDNSEYIVTAHHVIGGCKSIDVTFEGIQAPAKRSFKSTIVRVLPEGDLGLLKINEALQLPALRLAKESISKDDSYAGFGYPLGVPSASDQLVTLSVGDTQLKDILPAQAARELAVSGSRISIATQVLRINVALQPGMSGGPIIDSKGEVIGVVAGGLKAGSAPVSWAWTRESVRRLLASVDSIDQVVAISPIQYSSNELQQLALAQRDSKRVRCGDLEFYESGTRTLADLMRGADDFERVQHIIKISQVSTDVLNRERFRVWIHAETGATAVVPAGYTLGVDGNVCIASSTAGPFKLLVWGARTPTQSDVQWRSMEFEQRVIQPRMPYQFGFLIDPQLTTFSASNMGLVPGPQFRPNGLVFNRKGFTLAKVQVPFPGAPVPLAHAFHTLVAQSGAFLGVASLNDEIDPALMHCVTQQFSMPVCQRARSHLKEWTRFILATQLSTFPAI